MNEHDTGLMTISSQTLGLIAGNGKFPLLLARDARARKMRVVAAAIKGAFQEVRIDWGPGYRIYVGRDGNTLVILLGGGTKQRQQKDIENAAELWEEYKKRKKGS